MAAIAHKDIGDIWTPQGSFTVGGTPTDPTNITVRYLNAAGALTTLGPVSGGTGGGGIVRVSAGIFKTDIPLDAAGYWYAEFIGTGTAAATEWHELIVDPSPFSINSGLSDRALVGLGETKDWLQNQIANTAENLEIVRVINDVSDRMHYEAAREFKAAGANPQIRLFPIAQMSSPDPWYVDGQYMGDRNIWSRTVAIGDLATTPTLVGDHRAGLDNCGRDSRRRRHDRPPNGQRTLGAHPSVGAPQRRCRPLLWYAAACDRNVGFSAGARQHPASHPRRRGCRPRPRRGILLVGSRADAGAGRRNERHHHGPLTTAAVDAARLPRCGVVLSAPVHRMNPHTLSPWGWFFVKTGALLFFVSAQGNLIL